MHRRILPALAVAFVLAALPALAQIPNQIYLPAVHNGPSLSVDPAPFPTLTPTATATMLPLPQPTLTATTAPVPTITASTQPAPTATRTSTTAPAPTATRRPAPTATATTNPLNTGGRDLYNCTDFDTYQQALAVYLANLPGDPNRLDRDGDGIPCEDLPGAP